MSQNVEATAQPLPMMPMPMFYPPTAYPMMTNPFFMMPPTMDPSAMKQDFSTTGDASQMLPAVPSAIRAGDRPVGTAASILSGSAPTLSSLPPMPSALAPMPFAYPPYGYYFNPAMHAPGMMPMMPPSQLMPTPPPTSALSHVPGQLHVSPSKRASSFSNWHTGSSRPRNSASPSPSSPRTHSPTNSVHSSHDTEFSGPQSPTAALLSLASAASSARSTVHSSGSKRSRHLAGGSSRASSPDASHFVAVKTSKDASGSKIRTHQCSVCLKHFTRRSNLVAHIRIHTGDKPYQCTHPGCGKRFCQSSNLKRHTRIHYTTAKVDSNTSIHVWPLAGSAAGTPPAVPSPTSSTGSAEAAVEKAVAPTPAVAVTATASTPVAAAAGPVKKE